MQIYWKKAEFLHKKKSNSHRTGLEHQHSRRDVMSKLYIDFLDFEDTTLIKNRRHFYLINRRLYEWNWVDHISTSCFQEVLGLCAIILYAEALFSLLEWREMLSGTLKISGKHPYICPRRYNAKCTLVVKLKWRLFVQTAGKKIRVENKTGIQEA